MRRARLADGTSVACLNVSEARVLDLHVDGYLGHGIRLPADAVILDVGANIDLFGVRAVQRLPQARIFAFEPVPAIHVVAAANAAEHGQGRMTVFDFGLSAEPGRLEFTYFPRCPALSTAHPEDWDAPGAFQAAVRGNLAAARQATPLARLVPGFLSPLLARWLTGGRQHVKAELRTVSQVIDAQDLDRVDLLKIDCEGAELPVLQGVRSEHWPRIRQVVAEVHDLDGRLDAVRGLLTAQGFTLTTEREAGFEGTRLHNVFAVRAPA
ncbi:MAG: FkbM family methyltransferase [Myxococcales bacterium]|nr:FkbM family methyltransferase [Myxococcales bacterium]